MSTRFLNGDASQTSSRCLQRTCCPYTYPKSTLCPLLTTSPFVLLARSSVMLFSASELTEWTFGSRRELSSPTTVFPPSRSQHHGKSGHPQTCSPSRTGDPPIGRPCQQPPLLAFVSSTCPLSSSISTVSMQQKIYTHRKILHMPNVIRVYGRVGS